MVWNVTWRPRRRQMQRLWLGEFLLPEMPMQEREAVLQDLAGALVVIRLVEAVTPGWMDEQLHRRPILDRRIHESPDRRVQPGNLVPACHGQKDWREP